MSLYTCGVCIIPERSIWELKNQTICTILGLAFNERELPGIIKKLKLNNGKMSSFEMHCKLVQASSTQDRTSKQLDKLLSERFEPYKEKVKGLSHNEIRKYIEKGEYTDIPLCALIWYGVRNDDNDIKNIEAMIFGAVHMFEHRALRFYDTLSRTMPDSRPENVIRELNEVVRSNDKLQTKCNRLEIKKDHLISEIGSIKEDRSKIIGELEIQNQVNEQLKNDLNEITDENTLDRINELTRELDFLTTEVKTLSSEITQRDQEINKMSCELTSVNMNLESDIKDNGEKVDLNGLTVAYVGGVESLEPHYKEVIESFGGTFNYHCGRCLQGRKEIENLVDKTDLIFCPVDINSHKACKYVKKACRVQNKLCCFLRSSGLSMLVREIEKAPELKEYDCRIY